jgi:hypothetical protein
MSPHSAAALPGGPPQHRGFGSQLVTRTVERQLQGRITFDWEPNGLECRVIRRCGNARRSVPWSARAVGWASYHRHDDPGH